MSNVKKLGFATKVLIGLILGAIVGIIAGPSASAIGFIGTVFLRLLRCGVVPLIFCNIVLAVAGMGDVKKLGRIGIKLIVIFLATTFCAATVGLLTALIVNPGHGFVMTEVGEVAEQTAPTFSGIILNFFGTNIVGSMAEGTMLHIISFAIISGIGIMFMKEEDQAKLIGGFGLISRYIMSFLRLVMKFTPIGVFCLMANTTGTYGTDVLGPLGKFILTIYIGLAIHAFVIYGGLYAVGTHKNPFTFWKDIAPVWTTSFSTCSTAATMPVSMRICEENLGLRKEVSDLTIPLGANMNMDGNGLWYGVVAIFVAQVVGIDMNIGTMIVAILTGVLMTLGSPGIPGGIIVATTIFLQTMGMPIEFVALLAGIFSIMDMGITTVNCIGSVVVAAVVSASEERRAQKNDAPKA